MLEQELKNIWLHSSESERIKFDKSKLMIELNNKMLDRERKIRSRDRREIGAAVLAIVIYAYFIYEVPFPMAKMASILVIVSMLYIIYRLRKAAKNSNPLDLDKPFREQLRRDKTFFSRQQGLLDNVLYWYVLPPAVAVYLFVLSIGNPEAYNWDSWIADLMPVTGAEKGLTIVILTLMFGYVVWLNKRAAKENYGPILDEIKRVQNQFSKDD